jgi:hypothetical protein
VLTSLFSFSWLPWRQWQTCFLLQPATARFPASAIIGLRYFGGLGVRATVQVTGVSEPTAMLYEKCSKAWLSLELSVMPFGKIGPYTLNASSISTW